MSSRDFLKVSSLIGKLLKSEENKIDTVEGGKTDSYLFGITLLSGIKGAYRISIIDTGFLLAIDRTLFKFEKFESFIKRFEYELEQAFITNIVIDINKDDDSAYKIMIEF